MVEVGRVLCCLPSTTRRVSADWSMGTDFLGCVAVKPELLVCVPNIVPVQV